MMRSRVAKVRGKSLRPRDVIDKWKIIKGDTVRLLFLLASTSTSPSPLTLTAHTMQVQMMRGPDAGKQGKVLRVLRKKNKVVVEGINIVRSCRLSLCF